MKPAERKDAIPSSCLFLRHLYDEYLAFLGPLNGPLLSFTVGSVGLLCLRNLRSVLPVPSAPVRALKLSKWDAACGRILLAFTEK